MDISFSDSIGEEGKKFIEGAQREFVRKSRWGDLNQRREWLRRFDKRLIERRDEICATIAQEKGCSEFNALLNEYVPVRMLVRHLIKKAPRILRDKNISRPFSFTFGNKRVVKRYEPFGVVGVISPSNYPFSLPLGPILTALACGNVVFLKPADDRQKTNALLKLLLSDDEINWVANVLPATPELGAVLVKASSVHKIHFTGSVGVGWKIAQENAKVRLVPPTLELGGSNAAIVLEDADLDEASDVIVWARNVGMSCNGIKRVFAVEPIFGELVRMIRAKTHDLSPHETVCNFSIREKANFAQFCQDHWTREGFRPAHNELDDPTPTVLELKRYDPERLILREETFVPILAVVKVKDAEEALRCANDTKFGLGASVFTKDKKRFRELAAQLEVGAVNHNDALTEFTQPQIPFGGPKNSGWGYTHGEEGILDFVQVKTIVEERYGAPKLYLFPWTQKKMKGLTRWIDAIIKAS